MSVQVSQMDAKPLLHVLRALRDHGRDVKAGEATANTAQLLALAESAHAALNWLEADQAGELEKAARWLELVWASTPKTRPAADQRS